METKVVNIKNEPYDIYIGRPSKWGNPFPISRAYSRERSIQLYEDYIRHNPALILALPELCGKVLGCHCKPKACHGDILIKLLKEIGFY